MAEHRNKRHHFESPIDLAPSNRLLECINYNLLCGCAKFLSMSDLSRLKRVSQATFETVNGFLNSAHSEELGKIVCFGSLAYEFARFKLEKKKIYFYIPSIHGGASKNVFYMNEIPWRSVQAIEVETAYSHEICSIFLALLQYGRSDYFMRITKWVRTRSVVFQCNPNEILVALLKTRDKLVSFEYLKYLFSITTLKHVSVNKLLLVIATAGILTLSEKRMLCEKYMPSKQYAIMGEEDITILCSPKSITTNDILLVKEYSQLGQPTTSQLTIDTIFNNSNILTALCHLRVTNCTNKPAVHLTRLQGNSKIAQMMWYIQTFHLSKAAFSKRDIGLFSGALLRQGDVTTFAEFASQLKLTTSDLAYNNYYAINYALRLPIHLFKTFQNQFKFNFAVFPFWKLETLFTHNRAVNTLALFNATKSVTMTEEVRRALSSALSTPICVEAFHQIYKNVAKNVQLDFYLREDFFAWFTEIKQEAIVSHLICWLCKHKRGAEAFKEAISYGNIRHSYSNFGKIECAAFAEAWFDHFQLTHKDIFEYNASILKKILTMENNEALLNKCLNLLQSSRKHAKTFETLAQEFIRCSSSSNYNITSVLKFLAWVKSRAPGFDEKKLYTKLIWSTIVYKNTKGLETLITQTGISCEDIARSLQTKDMQNNKSIISAEIKLVLIEQFPELSQKANVWAVQFGF